MAPADSPAAAGSPGPDHSPGTGTANSSGTGAGTGRASQFGSYARMLHDRFFSQWVQPTSVVPSGSRMSALVKLRIERDGRVSAFKIIRSSGNVIVDESVGAVAQRVTQVDPLPSGLGGAFYEVNINFELKAEP
ncbi:MAG: TonB family protein [Chthoniobacterales bacterium]